MVDQDAGFKYIVRFILFCFIRGHHEEQIVDAMGKLIFTQPKEELHRFEEIQYALRG